MQQPARDADAIRSEQDLLRPIEAAFDNSRQLIGLEAEKFGVFDDGSPLLYHGERGVQVIFAELAARYGWRPEGEYADGPPIALLRDGASITLEPGSQLELSGAPQADVHGIAAEVERHRAELAALTSVPHIHWMGLGFHPFARQPDLDWVPKSRYVTMREYLPTRGRMGVDMMRRTATVQANFDFRSEADALAKMRTALAAAPLVAALFANSAVYEGARHPIKSHRAEVWLDVDPDRSGLLPFFWRADASLEAYVQWALDVPMFIFKRDGAAVRNQGQTFRSFMRDGFAGYTATMTDWEMHLNTLFPEVRLKRTLEVRSADSVPAQWSLALPALWAGILYDADALHAAGELLVPFGYEAWAAARAEVPVRGLDARVGGRPLRDLAVALLDIADGGLARRARQNAAGADERVYTAPLREIAAQGKSIGDVVLGDWSPALPEARAQLCERARY